MKRLIIRLRDRSRRLLERIVPLLRRAPRTRAFKISLAVIGVVALAAAWGSLFVGNGIDDKDPKAVATAYIEHLQDGKPNHAYDLVSEAFKKEHTDTQFRTKYVPDLIDRWPNYPARYMTSATLNKADENTSLQRFALPSDGQQRAMQLTIELTRQNANSPWRVNAVSSITNIFSKPERGKMQ